MIRKRPNKIFDVITFGRSSIDLYSNDIGAPFPDIKSFNAYVGGSSTNIAVGCARLGLRTSLLTAVGQDKVGDFVLEFLRREKVHTEIIPVLDGRRTSAVLLGIQPPDTFPLVYYRDNAADIWITKEHVEAAGIQNHRVLVPSGTALSKEPSYSSLIYAAEQANEAGTEVILDLDYRADQWNSLASYQQALAEVMPFCQKVIGTREELLSAFDPEANIHIVEQQISDPAVKGNIQTALKNCFSYPIDLFIMKNGASGAVAYTSPIQFETIDGFPVQIKNVLGAGDAFAAGFLKGYLSGWDISKSVRFANACGALLVTRHGCANFSPILEEVILFIRENGGW